MFTFLSRSHFCIYVFAWAEFKEKFQKFVTFKNIFIYKKIKKIFKENFYKIFDKLSLQIFTTKLYSDS